MSLGDHGRPRYVAFKTLFSSIHVFGLTVFLCQVRKAVDRLGDRDTAMAKPDDGSDASDSDSDASNDEDAWGSDDDGCSDVAYE